MAIDPSTSGEPRIPPTRERFARDTMRAGWNDIILGAIGFALALISATARADVAYPERHWYRR